MPAGNRVAGTTMRSLADAFQLPGQPVQLTFQPFQPLLKVAISPAGQYETVAGHAEGVGHERCGRNGALASQVFLEGRGGTAPRVGPLATAVARTSGLAFPAG